MLSNISWNTYFLFIATLTISYYIIIALLFYRETIQRLVTRNASAGDETNTSSRIIQLTQPQTEDVPQPHSLTNDAEDLDTIERIVNEIRYEVILKAGSHVTKEKLLVVFKNYLGTISGNFPMTFKNSITSLLIKEAVEQCHISFTKEEIEAIW
ncbi:MAG: hypothetical protein JST19_06695 [Bacteroidetes bacterium]|nr:hypothetical protein [Bacteroidota bacterium]